MSQHPIQAKCPRAAAAGVSAAALGVSPCRAPPHGLREKKKEEDPDQ